MPRYLTTRGEYFAHFFRGVPLGREKRTPPFELPQQENLAGVFVPVAVEGALLVCEAKPTRDRVEHIGMALRVLAHVESDKVNTEGRDPAQRIEQFAIRDLVHAAGKKRVVASLQGLGEIVICKHQVARGRVRIKLIRPVPRRSQAITKSAQHRAIGLALAGADAT